MKRFLPFAGCLLVAICFVLIFNSGKPLQIGMKKSDAIKAFHLQPTNEIEGGIPNTVVGTPKNSWSIGGRPDRFIIVFQADTVYSFQKIPEK